jgi:hypothetical protein
MKGSQRSLGQRHRCLNRDVALGRYPHCQLVLGPSAPTVRKDGPINTAASRTTPVSKTIVYKLYIVYRDLIEAIQTF